MCLCCDARGPSGDWETCHQPWQSSASQPHCHSGADARLVDAGLQDALRHLALLLLLWGCGLLRCSGLEEDRSGNRPPSLAT